MNRRHTVALLLWLLMGTMGVEQGRAQGQREPLRLLTYNVENLFDTCHDAGFDDYEFLPTSPRRWTGQRYWGKLGRVVRVLAAAGGDHPVDLVALTEVENDSVLRDLCRRTRLARLDYRYVCTRSADSRGIDVALLYQPERFRLLASRSLRVPPPTGYVRFTRDVLHVMGQVGSGDTLDLMVCHWPSHRGDRFSAMRYREQVARTLRRHADSLVSVRRVPMVVITGDFNDEPNAPSILRHLGAVAVPADTAAVAGSSESNALYLLSARPVAPKDIGGTYKYRGMWNRIDHVAVNAAMLTPMSPLQVPPRACHIFAPDFLSEYDRSYGGKMPHRYYMGPIYHGGYSDHYPLLTTFVWR